MIHRKQSCSKKDSHGKTLRSTVVLRDKLPFTTQSLTDVPNLMSDLRSSISFRLELLVYKNSRGEVCGSRWGL